MKDELIQFQESRLGEVKAEYQLMMVLEDIQRSISDHEGAAGSRGSEKKSGKSQNDIAKLINKLKNEYEGEVNRLKDFVHKEKQRSEATIRKVEAQHKEQLLGIHKESIHLLRAINRFKDTVAQILDKENLPDAAYYVRQLANLPTEEVPSDAKFLLGQMASNAVELLVAIEFKLSQALLNKRFEIKDNTIAKAFANKDLETIMAVMKKVKHNNQQMTDELRQTKQQLSAAEEALKGIRNEENTKYGSLTDRYKRLWGQFNALQKDYQLLEQNVLTKTNRTIAMKEMIKERKGKLQKELQAHKEMVKEMQKQQYSQSSVPGLTSLPEMRPCSQCKDYKKKLELLESSYRQSKISQERYEETKRLLEKSMDVAGVRLQRLFTRYVIFCRINGIKAKLLKYLETENLLPERHDKVNLYVQNMDQKLSLLSERWACEDEKMEMIRSLLNSELDHVFRNIVSELELPSAHSIILEFTTELPQLTPPVSNHTEKCERSGIQQVPPSSRGVFLPPLGKTSGIIGKCALTKVATEPCWQVASSLDTDELTSVTVTDLPRLVEMDMQDTRIRAGHRKSRSFFPLSKAEFCDYAWNPKESETRKTYQEINF
ncbi:uncharacterized protein LOC106153605 isoform X1 [Lingula anatina]|uniref:Uncharacterized protein LOC106153605 isoform X1 n=1 Tax=Lingula anatina TaxID=7574 RepID=A0A1S3HAM2_LINAN|nr:uncharacterized protein LOC106153605 isoform X1 [Lingula anatina]|eukprot:XP_013383053.1 uncharacterized protein LOC106153605 isoform X1 [Lingula anatina]